MQQGHGKKKDRMQQGWLKLNYREEGEGGLVEKKVEKREESREERSGGIGEIFYY